MKSSLKERARRLRLPVEFVMKASDMVWGDGYFTVAVAGPRDAKGNIVAKKGSRIAMYKLSKIMTAPGRTMPVKRKVQHVPQ